MYWDDVSQMWGMATLDPVAPGESIISFGSTTQTNLMIYVWLLLLRILTQKNDEMATQLDCQHRCLLRLRRIMCFKHQQHITSQQNPWEQSLFDTSELWMKSNSVSGKSPTRGTYWGQKMLYKTFVLAPKTKITFYLVHQAHLTRVANS